MWEACDQRDRYLDLDKIPNTFTNSNTSIVLVVVLRHRRFDKEVDSLTLGVAGPVNPNPNPNPNPRRTKVEHTINIAFRLNNAKEDYFYKNKMRPIKMKNRN